MRSKILVGALALGLCGCGDEAGEEHAFRHDALVGKNCGAITTRYAPLSTPIAGLAPLPGIPVPSVQPAADGTFHPEPGYTEGGRFASADGRAEWSVDPSLVAPQAAPGRLRVGEWNVARGNKLAKVVQVMRKQNADIWLLNETDLYGNNSGKVVVARELARALGYSYMTRIEFYERRDDRRGTSGNAILSRYPLRAGSSVDLPILEKEGGFDWSTSEKEPRCGQRSALAAVVDAPNAAGGTTAVKLVSMHLENEANAKVRRAQYEVARDTLVSSGEAAIAAGDFNTIGEAGAFRKYLQAGWEAVGRDEAFFDCSRGDNTPTFEKALVVNLRLDWMLVQSGTLNAVDCPAGSYQVRSHGDASDHKMIVTEMTVAGVETSPTEPAPPPSGGASCTDRCGDSMGTAGECFCDQSCVEYGDCCADACLVCGAC